MSDVMMKALQIQAESLTRQVETLGPENERVRKLLTEFDQRHDADQARIRELEAEKTEAYRRRDEWRKKAEGYDAVRLALREKVGDPWPPHMSRLTWAGIAADQKKRADDAEAELAALREARGVRVKPLTWVRADLSCWGEYADAGLLRYNLTWTYRDDPEVWFVMNCEHDQRVIYEGGDEDAAYQSAQDDCNRRILAALEPAPVTVGEAEAARVLLRKKPKDANIKAALVAHYGKSASAAGIEGADLTANDTNWTFKQGFTRMLRGYLRALADAGEAG